MGRCDDREHFARAIDMVGAGTDMQKARAVQEYGQNVQRQNMLGKIKDAGTNSFFYIFVIISFRSSFIYFFSFN